MVVIVIPPSIPNARRPVPVDGADIYDEDEVRQALDIGAHVPVRHCDARDRRSSKQVLVLLLEYLVATAMAAGEHPASSWPASRPR